MSAEKKEDSVPKKVKLEDSFDILSYVEVSGELANFPSVASSKSFFFFFSPLRTSSNTLDMPRSRDCCTWLREPREWRSRLWSCW